MFKRVLVANRGEIAVRILRACRELGVETALICAEVDRDSLPARMADQVLVLRDLAGRQAYLDIPRIVEAGRSAGAKAVHPGYGFLSENAAFSRACAEAGLVFVGPGPEAITALGDKTEARKLMSEAGLPVVPGTVEPVADVEEALREAERIGYPVLIKAAGGGGGRGMRKCADRSELERSFAQAASESQAAFGSSRLFLERYLEQPRHIEVQVLADQHGQAVHLFERECSIQRRFQKMLEEAPSPFLDEGLRRTMGEAAVRGALKAGYAGACTFEFLVDKNRSFYFLEVNTRLQVEHPVSELITGVDLVLEQLRIAAGEPLALKQEEIRLHGWSIECRITCEDPYHGFRPDPGPIQAVHLPAGPGGRVDSHLYPQACRRMLAALDEMVVAGVSTSIPFHRALLEHPEFRRGNLSTHFLAEHLGDLKPVFSDEERELAALAAALSLHRQGGDRRAELVARSQEEAALWRLAAR
ncbi:ATP-grasp domain-containing protein [bacterium CPR1]|nr:ATP-grasp domain-containing protein [bacterium CPR1]